MKLFSSSFAVVLEEPEILNFKLPYLGFVQLLWIPLHVYVLGKLDNDDQLIYFVSQRRLRNVEIWITA